MAEELHLPPEYCGFPSKAQQIASMVEGLEIVELRGDAMLPEDANGVPNVPLCLPDSPSGVVTTRTK